MHASANQIAFHANATAQALANQIAFMVTSQEREAQQKEKWRTSERICEESEPPI